MVVPCMVNSWLKTCGRDEMVVRNRQLDAHDRRFQAADHEEQDAVEDVHQAELLVIDRDDPFVHAVEQRPGSLLRGRNRHWLQNRFGVRHQGVPMLLLQASSDSQ